MYGVGNAMDVVGTPRGDFQPHQEHFFTLLTMYIKKGEEVDSLWRRCQSIHVLLDCHQRNTYGRTRGE